MPVKIGDKFGDWTVIGKSDKKNYIKCRCKCGTIKDVDKRALVRGKSKMCRICSTKQRDYKGLKRYKYAFKPKLYKLKKVLSDGSQDIIGYYSNVNVDELLTKIFEIGESSLSKNDLKQCQTIDDIKSVLAKLYKDKKTNLLLNKTPIIDYTYQKIDFLTPIKVVGFDKFQHSLWECKCECGNVCVRNSISLKLNNGFKSCGCTFAKTPIKQHDNKLNFLNAYPVENKGKIMWKSQLYINKKCVYLGLYDTPQEASEAAQKEKEKYLKGLTENEKNNKK